MIAILSRYSACRVVIGFGRVGYRGYLWVLQNAILPHKSRPTPDNRPRILRYCPPKEYRMLSKHLLCLFALAAFLGAQQPQRRPASSDDANDQDNPSTNGGRGQTLKQLARGNALRSRFHVAASDSRRRAHAPRWRQCLDAIVAGQAVLGLMQPNLNGMGSDATLLIYDAKTQKVWSLNAEGTAPKLATIEW